MLAAVLLAPATAAAVAPGTNAGIVFRAVTGTVDFKRTYDIYRAGPNGEDPQVIATNAGGTAVPYPDGESVAVSDLDSSLKYLIDLDGEFVRNLTTNTLYDFSADGKLMAVIESGSQDIAIEELATGRVRPLGIRNPDPDVQFLPGEPRFTPDGKQIVFDASYKDPDAFAVTHTGIFKVNVDGSGLVQLTPEDATYRYPSVSPDGKRIAYEKNFRDIGVMSIGGGGAHTIIESESVPGGSTPGQPAWSPDGTRIARAQRNGSTPAGQGVFAADPEGAEDAPLVTEADVGGVSLFDPRPRWLAGRGTVLAGKVKDGKGKPVRGVVIKAKGKGGGRAVTDARGRYEIGLDVEKRQRYKVKPSLAGAKFKPKKRKVTVSEGETKRANFEMQGYLISGEVKLGCSQGKCSKLPVGGVKVVARQRGGGKKYSAKSDTDGFFQIVVRKGRYVVRSVKAALMTKPRKKTVNVKKRPQATADFESCKPAAEKRQGAPGVPTSTWATSFECDDFVQIAYNEPGSNIHFRWLAAPTCSAATGPYVDDRLFVVFGGTKRGHAWQELNSNNGSYLRKTPQGVDFIYPAGGGDPPLQFWGTLPASGDAGTVSGTVSRVIKRKACYFTMRDANIYRQGTGR